MIQKRFPFSGSGTNHPEGIPFEEPLSKPRSLASLGLANLPWSQKTATNISAVGISSLCHQTRSSRTSKMRPIWTPATKKSQLCKPSTFQNRVRCPYFQTLRTQRTISRRVRHGELCSKQRYRPLESDTQEAEVSRLGFCRFIRPIYSLCFTVSKLPAEF